MSNQDTIWLAKVIQKDVKTEMSLVMVRGIFQCEAEARRLATAFGCDALVFAEPGQRAELGSLAVVTLSHIGVDQ